MHGRKNCIIEDEDRLQAIYEIKFKRLKTLDNLGVKSSIIDATRASIRKLQKKNQYLHHNY